MKCPICKDEFEYEPSCGHVMEDYIDIIEKSLEIERIFQSEVEHVASDHYLALECIKNMVKILEGRKYFRWRER